MEITNLTGRPLFLGIKEISKVGLEIAAAATAIVADRHRTNPEIQAAIDRGDISVGNFDDSPDSDYVQPEGETVKTTVDDHETRITTLEGTPTDDGDWRKVDDIDKLEQAAVDTAVHVLVEPGTYVLTADLTLENTTWRFAPGVEIDGGASFKVVIKSDTMIINYPKIKGTAPLEVGDGGLVLDCDLELELDENATTPLNLVSSTRNSKIDLKMVDTSATVVDLSSLVACDVTLRGAASWVLGGSNNNYTVLGELLATTDRTPGVVAYTVTGTQNQVALMGRDKEWNTDSPAAEEKLVVFDSGAIKCHVTGNSGLQNAGTSGATIATFDALSVDCSLSDFISGMQNGAATGVVLDGTRNKVVNCTIAGDIDVSGTDCMVTSNHLTFGGVVNDTGTGSVIANNT